MLWKTWLIILLFVGALFAALGGAAFAIREGMPAEQREVIAALGAERGGMLILALVAVVGIVAGGVHLILQRFAAPLASIAEQLRMVALTSRDTLLDRAGDAEVCRLIDGANVLIDRYLTLQRVVDERIREASRALEEEKAILVTLMSKLTQGVIVCNPDGRILLYNNRAQALLEGPSRLSGGADWLGLGRRVSGLIDSDQLDHALAYVRDRMAAGDRAVLVPFVATRAGGQMLNVHLMPLRNDGGSLLGYLLTLDDITRRSGTESRRGALLRSLSEGQRSAIAGIRAAIETIFAFPDMDEGGRQEFLGVIRDEAVRLSDQLNDLEQRYAEELRVHLPMEEIQGADMLSTVKARVGDALGVDLEVSAPLEPIWLKIDAFAVSRVVLFLIEQLRLVCRAGGVSLSIEDGGALATCVLAWDGALLHPEALRRWGARNVLPERNDGSSTLFEVIERHGGAIWTGSVTPSGRPCIRLVLPICAGRDPLAAEPVADDSAGPSFDFRLFAGTHKPEEWDDLPLDKLIYTVIDTETTGLNPLDGDEIIALGAVRIVNGKVRKREICDYLINPRRPVSQASQAIHGISQEMLRGMPTIEEMLPRFYQFVGETVLLGHEVGFDLRFFQMKEAATGIRFSQPVIDTLYLDRLIHPHQEDARLEAIAARLGITATGRHTALGDALTTGEVFLALLPLLAGHGITTLGEARKACAASPLARRLGY